MNKFVSLMMFVLLSFTGCKSDSVTTVTVAYNRVIVASEIASTDDGNIAENTIDQFLDTRWLGEGHGATIAFDLEKSSNVAFFALVFYNDAIRFNNFDIEVSLDNVT